MSNPMPCDQIRELIPGIAAGSAAGDERAYALRHLSSCADCRHELTETTETVDELLTLAGGREPPLGFESTVLTRIAPPRRHPRLPRATLPRVACLASSLAVVAGLAAGTVWWATADDRALAAGHRETLGIAHGKAFSAAPLMMAGGGPEIATIFAYEGDPSWFYATFRRRPASGRYAALLITRDGRRLPLRELQVNAETVGWGSRISFRVRDLDTIEFRKSGALAMSAQFSPA